MTNKIEVGDIVLAGCNKSKAEVVDLNKNGYQYVVKYLTTLDNKVSTSSRKYYYHFVELFQKAGPKLYTIHGGTTPYELVARYEDYAWVKRSSNVTPNAPFSVRYSSLTEIVPEKFVRCLILGTQTMVYKRCKATEMPNLKDQFLTEHGSVLRVLEIRDKPLCRYSNKWEEMPSPQKIPMLEGKKIKFV